MLSPVDANTGMDLDADMDEGPVTASQNIRAGGARIGPAQKTTGTKLRTSCDACQDLKIKCSQDKPTCRRCSKKGLDCVYSPLRRMGRPKKSSIAPSAAPSVTSSSSRRPSATRRSQSKSLSQSQSRDNQSRRHVTTTLSPASLTEPQPPGPALNGMEESFGANASFGVRQSDLDADGVYFSNGGTVLGVEDDTLTSPYPATLLEDRPRTEALVNDGFISHSAGLSDPPAMTRQQSRLLKSPLAALVGLDSQVGPQEQISPAADGDQTTREAGNCYLAILQRLTQLETTVETGPHPPRLDVILSAERDTRALKEHILSCQGHGSRETEIFYSPITPREVSTRSCIHVHGSSLLVLGLLADRVMSLLEDLFRRAAVSAHSMDQATRGTTASWLYGPLPEFTSQAGERQYERSVRGSFSRNIHCPVPEANCELTIGNYEVDDEVKSRVMKLILKRRVCAMERMLKDLKDYFVDDAVQVDRLSHYRDSQVAGEQGSVLLGSIKRSQSLTQASIVTMVEDLHRRAEMLRGRLELAAY